MWITKLQLSNVKSYGPDSPIIRFQPGVNLIQGHNGAGKSTILEAIGLALFGSSPYNQNQLVREGARHGEIMVGFISARDDREYEVVRRVGGSRVYVVDPEANRRICEGVEDTAGFLHQHLNVEPDTDLKTLFEDAIGVPQGTMTAIFLERASTRKDKFNRLLRIDAYEKAWERLRDTGRYIDEQVAANREAQARLRGALDDLPAVAARAESLAGDIDAAERELAGIQETLAAHHGVVMTADALKEQLDELDRQRREFDAEIDRLVAQHQRAAADVDEAQAAEAVIAEAEAGYQAFEQAQDAQRDIEGQRTTRDALRQQLGDLEADLKIKHNDLAHIEDDLAHIAAAEAEAERLAPLVVQQDQLEAELADLRQQMAEFERAAAVLDQHSGTLDTLAQRLGDVCQPLRDGGLTPPDDEAVASREGSIDAQSALARDALGELGRAVGLWTESRAAAERDAQELEQLQAGRADIATLQVQLDSARADQQTAADEIAELRQQFGAVTHDLGALDDHEALLNEADAVCPVCQRPMDDHARTDAQTHYAAQRAALTNSQEALNAQLAAAQEVQGAAAELAASVQAAIAQRPSKDQVQAAQSRLDEGRDMLLAREVAALEAWQSADGALAGYAVLLDELREAVAAVDGAGAQADALQTRLAALEDPRRAQEKATEVAARRPAVEAEHLTQQNQLADLQARVERMTAELEDFAALDTDIQAIQQALDEHHAAHQRYLKHIDLAGRLAERQEVLAAVAAELAERQAARDDLVREYDDRAAGYDEAAHRSAQEQVRLLEREQVRLQTRLEELVRQQADVQDTLARLQAMQAQLVEAGQDEARLARRQEAFTFVRGAIREAGPRITRQLVQVVATQANRIFGDILGDHSPILTWSDDYAVSIIYGGEERSFELLSGGEQMAAAIAIRLALLTQLGGAQFAFFDEPTANLDDTRRDQLAERLAAIHSLQQVFVISHDDTFEQESYHVIQVHKEDGLSQVDVL